MGDPVIVGGEGQFALVGNECPSQLAPGESCAVKTRFTPASGGAQTGTLDVPVGDQFLVRFELITADCEEYTVRIKPPPIPEPKSRSSFPPDSA